MLTLPAALTIAALVRAAGTGGGAARAASTRRVTRASQRHLTTFETFLSEAMDRLGVLGAAVAVVAGDDVILLRGFGARALDDRAPVTPDTLMMIDSLTKPMTTMMTATLVDDGRLTWETPVRDLLPGFALARADPATPLAIADLFCGCAGVPRNDAEILFNAAEITPDRLIALAAGLPVNAAPGERFQYTNHLFAIGGYAAAAAGGAGDDLRAAYRRAMRERVLSPLRMPRSTFDDAEATRDGDYAVPAAPSLLGELEALPLEGEEAFARAVEPAGGLWSSAREMARWLQAQVSGGVAADGERVVSRRNLLETWRPHVPIPPDPALPPVLTAMTRGYGLGWFVGEYAGRRLLSHSGGVSGFVSEIAFLPEERLGVVVLTNGGAGAHAFALAAPLRLFELLLDQPPIVEALLGQQIAVAAARAEDRRAELGAVDARAVAPYLGEYRNPRLGEITLRMQDGALMLDAGEIRSELRPRVDAHGEVVAYLFVAPPLASLPVSVTFTTGENGAPWISLVATGEGAATYEFVPTGGSSGGTPAGNGRETGG